MAFVEHRHLHVHVSTPRDITRSINFTLGVVLIALSILFMFVSEVLAPGLGDLNSFLLGLVGVLSLWAGFSERESTVYAINMVIGLMVILGSGALGLLQYFDPVSWRIHGVWEVSPPLLYFQAALGVTFILIAYRRKRRRIAHDTAQAE